MANVDEITGGPEEHQMLTYISPTEDLSSYLKYFKQNVAKIVAEPMTNPAFEPSVFDIDRAKTGCTCKVCVKTRAYIAAQAPQLGESEVAKQVPPAPTALEMFMAKHDLVLELVPMTAPEKSDYRISMLHGGRRLKTAYSVWGKNPTRAGDFYDLIRNVEGWASLIKKAVGEAAFDELAKFRKV